MCIRDRGRVPHVSMVETSADEILGSRRHCRWKFEFLVRNVVFCMLKTTFLTKNSNFCLQCRLLPRFSPAEIQTILMCGTFVKVPTKPAYQSKVWPCILQLTSHTTLFNRTIDMLNVPIPPFENQCLNTRGTISEVYTDTFCQSHLPKKCHC